MKYVPEQGDIVQLDFDPSTGQEIRKVRPAIVLSRSIFNKQTKFAVVAPITSSGKDTPLTLELPNQMTTKGFVVVYQQRSLDYVDRQMSFIEKVNDAFLKDVISKVKLIVS